MLYLSMGRLRTRRKIAGSKITKKGQEENGSLVETEIDPQLLHVSKDILESPELKAIAEHDTAIKTWVRARCLPSPFKGKGILILPVRLIQEVAEEVEASRRDRGPLIDRFIEMYAQRKQEAQIKLGAGYDENDYPSIDLVREAFTFEFQMWELSAPGQLQAINRELYQRELTKLQNMWGEASHQVTTVLLQEFRKLTAHVAEKLQPGENGKPKVFRDTTVTNLTTWLELFKSRNLTDDQTLVETVERARQLITGIHPDTIRDSDTLRAELATDFANITSTLDAALIDRPLRAIDLTEE
jgi:antitoxin component HigA of HigAB toxin-antitoxin module